MVWPAAGARTVWFFDLDNTLHDAGSAVFPRMNAAMTEYIHEHLGLPMTQADALRVHYWQRYGSTRLPGLKILLTNAPAHYARRVLKALRIEDCFDAVIPIEQMTLFGHLRPKPDRRLFRTLSVQMKIAPQRCVLVEDTLEHQKAAKSEGWRTVWMQRWMRAGQRSRGVPAQPLHRCPVYVDRRISRLAAL